jgi:hypothetical protein
VPLVVTLLGFLAGTGTLAQFAKRENASKGPRAIGLLQIGPGGKARLIPISIMVDGKFFDASAYKATPVPMALEGGTVYEAMRTGNSVGLFTVTGVQQRKDTWLAQGTWLPAGSKPPSTGLRAETQPREDEDRPPTLRHGGSQPAAPPSQPPSEKSPASTTKPPVSTPDSSSPTARSSPPVSTSAPPAAGSPPDESSAPEDPDRPQLRRGKPAPKPKQPSPKATASSSSASPRKADVEKTASTEPASDIQFIPAISDAGGPEPRPYAYRMKPEEEQVFRKKILALATTEIVSQAKDFEPENSAASSDSRARGKAISEPKPTFDDVKLRVFDVSTSNEPILVCTARARLAQRHAKASENQPAHDYYITLVAHSDLYGELRKLFSAVTDNSHLDVTPRMDLIDAVDADGDGRAELLFRQTFDSGTAYVIYRVGADQLWPLFQGTPAGQP